MSKLSQSTIENLKYYVYLLIDPRTDKPFYVGKGHGNRVNQHVLGALETDLDEVKKLKRIHEIINDDLEVGHIIVRHGLSSDAAFEVECALIDYIGMSNLTNIVSGHYSAEHGLMSLRDIELKYQAEPAEFTEPAILININRLYHPDMSPDELYTATRQHWAVDIDRARKISVTCAVFVGIIREVYEVDEWTNSPPPHDKPMQRSYFTGKVAPQATRDKYLNRSVAKYWKKGSQNPIKYVS